MHGLTKVINKVLDRKSNNWLHEVIILECEFASVVYDSRSFSHNVSHDLVLISSARVELALLYYALIFIVIFCLLYVRSCLLL